MAKVIKSLLLDDIELGTEEIMEAFKNHELYFEFTPMLENSDRQAIKNTIAIAFNHLTGFGLVEDYTNLYGTAWRMWVGKPTETEMKENPLNKPTDPLYDFMDLLFKGKEKKE